MQITRERFVDHFSHSLLVHTLGMWPRSTKRFPEHIARSIYETLQRCLGLIPIDAEEFTRIVEPCIRELHASTPFRKRPDFKLLTGLVYDALDRAGIEIGIGPPIRSHGGAAGTGPSRKDKA